LSLLWGWFIDKKKPDKYDWIGSCVALIGAAIIIWMDSQMIFKIFLTLRVFLAMAAGEMSHFPAVY